MIYTYLFILVPIVTALAHIGMLKRPFKEGRLLELWLIHFVFWGIGGQGVWTFIANSCGFLNDWTAHLLHWPAGSHVQYLVGWVWLAIGVLGIGAFCFKGGFLVAAVAGYVILSVGSAFVLFFHDASWMMRIYAIVYYLGGSAFLAALWLMYWMGVGTDVAGRCCGTLGKKGS